MAPEIQKLEGQPPDKRRNLLAAFLVMLLLFLVGIVIWSSRGAEPGGRTDFVPSPVAPLGPSGQRD